MLYPIFFHPIFKERIWGGRKLEHLYKKSIPPGKSIGESWEIVDRADESSVVANGPLAGQTLTSLMERYRAELLGDAKDSDGRFPLLIKILDAREKLSLQVHPPASKARALGGEPKTEMWYVADAGPDSDLFVGLKHGVSRDLFETRLREGKVQECFHHIPVRRGDAMFLPSGRVHALGGGNVIFEVQQNSDTTYRVFDWNRLDAGGKPRELHVAKSLESIDFEDFEPGLIEPAVREANGVGVRSLVDDSLFQVRLLEMVAGRTTASEGTVPRIYGVVEGAVRIESAGGTWGAPVGSFCLVPASVKTATLTSVERARVLEIRPG